jgi:hypothetical protein
MGAVVVLGVLLAVCLLAPFAGADSRPARILRLPVPTDPDLATRAS